VRFLLVALLWLLAPLSAVAGDLVVQVRTPQGAPIVDAVASVAVAHPGPIRFAWPYRMSQHDIQFDPFVLIVPVGAVVEFPNLDRVRHHVYSFSPAKVFQLKLYGHEQTRIVHFDKPGVVQLGCNIHDRMIAFIDVVTTPLAARTDASGVAVIHDVPAGVQSLTVWRPYLHAPGNALVQSIDVASAGGTRVSVVGELRAPAPRARMY